MKIMDITTWIVSYASNASDASNVNLQTLEELNASKAEQRLPTVIFLIILIIIGVIGNTVVIVVYSLKYPPSTFRLYILTLAVIDLLSCLIPMPLEVVDNTYPLMFYSEGFCKSGRFIGNILKIGSAFVLVVIAFGRYKKICHPFSKATTLTQARLCCAAAILLAIVLSWPNAIIQGIKEVHLPGNITGFDCSIDDSVGNTEYPFIYFTVLFVLIFFVFLLLGVLYFVAILALRRHSTKKSTLQMNDKHNKMNKKITKVMIAITVAFILCYLPNFLLDAVSTFKRGVIFQPSPIVLGILPLFARAYFINNIINPFIYFVGDSKFRQTVQQNLRCVRLSFLMQCRKKKRKETTSVKESICLKDVKSQSG